jgi:hypothetical protein
VAIGLYDVPDVLGGMAELTACNTGTEAEVADSNGVVLELVGKVVVTLSHGADEDAYALLGPESLNVVLDAYDGTFKGESNLPAVGWQVFGDGVLDDAEQLFLGGGRADGHAVQELDHETGEAFEGTGDANAWVYLDEDALGGVDVDLEFAHLVNGGVEEGEKALCTVGHWLKQRGLRLEYLVSYVGSCVADIASHLTHDANVLVAVEQRVLVVTAGA